MLSAITHEVDLEKDKEAGGPKAVPPFDYAAVTSGATLQSCSRPIMLWTRRLSLSGLEPSRVCASETYLDLRACRIYRRL